jgi:hypothetical protein
MYERGGRARTVLRRRTRSDGGSLAQVRDEVKQPSLYAHSGMQAGELEASG